MASFRNIFNTNRSLSKNDIRRYNKGEMKDKELYETEHIMSGCPLSNDAVEGFKDNPKALDRVPDFNTFKAHLNSQGRRGGIRHIRPIVNRLAAALIGVVMVSGIYLYWNEGSNERLFARHFDTYESNEFSNLRSGEGIDGTAPDELLSQAAGYYEAQDYDNAVDYLNAHLNKKPADLQTLFFLGIAHLENHQPQAAIQHFSIVAGQSSKYKEEAIWRLALAQVKAEDISGAKATLQDLQGASAYYADKAEALLKDLD
jgi:hypothetical protein